jgi:CRP/FNR family transcriptional regulator
MNKKIIGIISSAPMFSGLSEDDISGIANIIREKDVLKGEMIFSDGEPSTGFYIVASGSIKIFKLSPDGKEKILHIFGKGQPFAEVAVFSGAPYPANALALQKSHLLFFPRNEFVSLITKKPDLALSMLGVMAARLREFTVQIENLTLKDVPGRLAGYLLYLVEGQNNKSSVDLDVSKNHLASLLGATPETLSRVMARMAQENLVSVEGRTISILDRAGLENLSSSGRGGLE